MGKHPKEVDPKAPIHWVPPEEFFAYFNSLAAEDRWNHPQYHDQHMIWHWEERRWWALEADT